MMQLLNVLKGGRVLRRALLVVMLVAVAGLGTANAQAQRVDVSLGGGGTTLFGDIGDSFGGIGRNFDLGVTVNLTEMVGIRFDYLYGRFTESRDIVAVNPLAAGPPTRVNATHPLHAGLFDLVVTSPTDRVKVYGLGGGGIYRRKVSLSASSTDLIPGFCDPLWFVCYAPEPVPREDILGSRSSTDFGVNVGVGVVFEFSDNAALFVEGRYHYVWGPEIEELGVNPRGGSPRIENANGTYLPFTFGIRFGG